MALQIGKYLLIFIICILAQVLIFNYITLFYVAIPIIFIFFIIRLPININKSLLFTFAFFTGLLIDIFSDTPGVNTIACVVVSALRQPIYYAYVEKDDHTDNLVPSVATLGMASYCKYLLTFVGIYCVLLFSIEYFSFADVKDIAIMSGASTFLSFVILLAIDCLIPAKS